MTWVVLLLTAVIGGAAGLLVMNDKGYVLIAYDHYTLETTLWVAAVTLIVAYLVVRLVFAVTRRLMKGSGAVSIWRGERRARSAREQTVKGLLLMSEGRYADASRLLLNAAERVETPLINYLSAARAAHELGELDARDALLGKAHETTPGAKFAVALTQAQLQMGKSQWEQCLATLLQLKQEAPRHPLVLEMLKEVYRHVGDWQGLIDLLPQLKKHKVVDADEAVALAVAAWCGLFESVAEANGNLAETYQKMPKDLRRNPTLIDHCASALATAGTTSLFPATGESHPVIPSASWSLPRVG
jgi:HemY protein